MWRRSRPAWPDCLHCPSFDEENPLRPRVWAAIISGLAFASAAGLSVYVTFTFAIFAILWALLALAQKIIKTFATYMAAGCFFAAALLAIPVGLALKAQRRFDCRCGRTLRVFRPSGLPSSRLAYLQKAGLHDPLLLNFSKLPVLLVVYLFEFGFFALILLLRLRQDMRSSTPISRQRRMMWVMFVVCLLTMSVVQSDSTGTNDLGFRGILVVQFVLLVWSAPIIHDVFFRSRAGEMRAVNPLWIKPALILTLVLGVAGTAYQFVALRATRPWRMLERWIVASNSWATPGFGERTYWLREGWAELIH